MLRSPEQQFAMAKRLPIPELAKVLQGQSDVVDMSIAEMVLRQKMQAQKAQQGMAAQPTAQAPKVVEQDLMQAQQMSQPAMGQGVAALPADVDVPEYAGGGIVAFSAGGLNKFQDLPLYNSTPSGPAGSMSELFGRVVPSSNIERRIDPVTKMPVTFGEYLRLVEQRSAEEAKKNVPTALSRTAAFSGDAETQPGGFYGVAAASPAATTTPSPDLNYGAIFERAKGIAGQINPAVETSPTVKQAVDQQREAMREAGFDFNLIKDQIAQVRQEKEQSKEDRKEAVNLRLLEAGLGILGGESPYAFVNIGKGASPALKGLSEDIKDLKKIDRERDKAMRDLAVADNQIASGMGLAALKTREAAQDRIARADEARATRTASIFSTLTSADTQRYVANQTVAASKEGKADDQDFRFAKQAQDAAIKLVNEGTTKFASPADKEAEISRLTAIFYQQLKNTASGKVAPATSGPRGRVINGVYVPAGQ